ncbi:hypothetical protein CRE_11897 [Caenorhabditis remanei]|uniref:Uncharacterized protein n=1 Tax=Caenorhabditis remanei TaxID=31234 RepID=E3M4D0_CAERE|nr:hypothetical protein CRE_11897 [Caenorhabditis remanei]
MQSILINVIVTLLVGFSFGIDTNDDIPDELELIFVHTIWRHGDRSQEGHLNNDPVDPTKWIEGGGGYGQLTPRGMEQQYKLGKKLRDRYVSTGFLHNFYDSQQVYIRSTDVNRTINSAISNMLGMFSSSSQRPGICIFINQVCTISIISGVDYPDIEGWPRGFMPVPIHSSGPASQDCVASAFCSCKRRNALLEIAHKGEQFQNFINSEKYINITSQVSELFNTTFTFDNLWQVHDAIMIQLIHFREIVYNQTWYSDEFFENLDDLERPSKAFVSGLYDPPIVDGINVRKEILKTRGGPLINDISDRMRTISQCKQVAEKCDVYHKNLKYYAFSTHDHTVFALLAVLGLETVVAGEERYGEWPDYASDILVELFQNDTNRSFYFRVLYQRNTFSKFEVVTPLIQGCKSRQFCDIQVFEDRAKEFRPDRPMKEFCEILPREDNRVSRWIKNVFQSPDQSTSNNYKWYLSVLVAACLLIL